MNEVEALTILSGAPTLGPVKIRLLIERFGSALDALSADPEKLGELPGFTSTIIQHWGRWESDFSWKKNLDLAKRLDVQIIPYTSPSYPRRLLELPDHPILLYVMGDLRGADQHSIAVVGTRRASVYGLEMAEKISRDLAAYGYTVVSGLARGIDTAAHQGALKKGRTVAVIGSGLANIYPKENLELAKHITNKGALISEYPMTTPPDRQNFPQRNRIVSGITMGSLLVEAPERSGAMITMNKAWGQGKKLFALPGRIGTNFCGNHQLIKQGKAQLIESAAEIDQDFGNLFNLNAKNTKSKDSYPPLDKEEKMLLNHLPNEPFAIEELVKITDLPIIKLNILLLSLVVKKVIKECPGKFYRKAW